MPEVGRTDPGYQPLPTATTTPTTTTGPTFTLTGPTPLTGPSLLPTDTAKRGKARFEAEMSAAQGRLFGGAWSHDFNQWVLGLREDPNDPEYNSILAWAKGNAERKEKGLDASANNAGEKGTEGFKIPEGILKKPTLTAAQPAAGGDTTSTAPVFQGGFKSAESDAEFGTERFQGGTLQTQKRPDDESPGNAELNKFRRDKGLMLPPEDASRSKTSGEYVYMGTEKNPNGKAQRDLYMTADDAKNAIGAIPEAKIASYQKMLGLPQTGKIDNDLMGLWNQAVQEAQVYATQGRKVSVQELFDIRVNALAARLKARGGGGGGGGGGLEQDPEDMAAADYYFAMMQILGDTSGVQS